MKQDVDDDFNLEVEEEGEEKVEDLNPPFTMVKEQELEVSRLVDTLLEGRLGDKAHLMVRYLGRPGPRRNTMPVLSTAKASIR